MGVLGDPRCYRYLGDTLECGAHHLEGQGRQYRRANSPHQDAPRQSGYSHIARELALRLVELSFPPDAAHTLGIAHVIADRLSRMHAPDGKDYQELHPALRNAKQTKVLARNAAWYRAF